MEENSIVATLDLGNTKLIIRQREDGAYSFFTHDDSGEDDVLAMTVSSVKKRFSFEPIPVVTVLQDYDMKYGSRSYDLLTPAGRPPVVQLKSGKLYCRRCNCYVPNTANNEMRKEGFFAHSHCCGIRADGERYIDVMKEGNPYEQERKAETL